MDRSAVHRSGCRHLSIGSTQVGPEKSKANTHRKHMMGHMIDPYNFLDSKVIDHTDGCPRF